MINKKEFKELENKEFTILEENEIVEISGGGAFDILIDIINHFRK